MSKQRRMTAVFLLTVLSAGCSSAAETTATPGVSAEAAPSASGVTVTAPAATASSAVTYPAGTETFVITRLFSTDTEYVQNFISTQQEEQTCTDIYLNAEGYIEVVVTSEEKQNWIEAADEAIDRVTSNSLNSDGYALQINEERNAIEILGTAGLDIDQLTEDFNQLAQNAEFWQIFSGVSPWYIDIQVYSDDTGELLQEVHMPSETITLSSDLWAQ